jgi:NAD(P)-dependent dehydrogenase (short-subunit alcohol dehydrogenase family)
MKNEDKTIIVTGAAGGLGFGCATRFAADGWKVALVDIESERGENAAATLRETGGKARFYTCDVGIKIQVDATIAAVIADLGDIHAMVANAGINRPANFLELTEEAFDLVIRTNLKSVFLFGQGVAKHMVEKKIEGSIVNMGSTSAVMTMPKLAAYASSKGGISALTNAMALSLAEYNIRVNAIGPGTILTDMTRARLYDDVEQRNAILSRTPMRRFGTPADVAGLAAFLAGPDSSYLTGQTIFLEGGRMGLNYTVPVSA